MNVFPCPQYNNYHFMLPRLAFQNAHTLKTLNLAW